MSSPGVVNHSILYGCKPFDLNQVKLASRESGNPSNPSSRNGIVATDRAQSRRSGCCRRRLRSTQSCRVGSVSRPRRNVGKKPDAFFDISLPETCVTQNEACAPMLAETGALGIEG